MARLKDFWPRPIKLDLEAYQDSDVLCQCRQVSVGIVRQYLEQGVRDLPQLMARTWAGTGCGQCRKILQDWIQLAQKLDSDQAPCTARRVAS